MSAGYSSQPNELYGARRAFNSWQTSASLGSKSGDWSWWLNLNRTDSQGQPQTFTTVPVAAVPGAAGKPVRARSPGSIRPSSPGILGSGTQYHTVQGHAKLKLAYDIDATLRASYTGLVAEQRRGRTEAFDGAGRPAGLQRPVNIQGARLHARAHGLPADQRRADAFHARPVARAARRASSTGSWPPASTTTPRIASAAPHRRPAAGRPRRAGAARARTARAGTPWPPGAPGARETCRARISWTSAWGAMPTSSA